MFFVMSVCLCVERVVREQSRTRKKYHPTHPALLGGVIEGVVGNRRTLGWKSGHIMCTLLRTKRWQCIRSKLNKEKNYCNNTHGLGFHVGVEYDTLVEPPWLRLYLITEALTLPLERNKLSINL